MNTITLTASKKQPIPGVQFSNVEIAAHIALEFEGDAPIEKAQKELTAGLCASYCALQEAGIEIKKKKATSQNGTTSSGEEKKLLEKFKKY